MLFPIVSLAVAAILFEGGLTLKFSELKSSGNIVLRLVSAGALVSWVLTSLAAWLLLSMDGRLAILLGAILVVTGPTVVMPLLRHIRPSRRIGSIVKWEGIVIDPIGAVLAVLVFEQLFVHADDASTDGHDSASGTDGRHRCSVGRHRGTAVGPGPAAVLDPRFPARCASF